MTSFFVDKKGQYRYLRIAGIMLLLIILLWVINLVFLVCNADRGSFGDMFGAVNSVFSGLAFAGIILTIIMQREELKLQRNELQLTREEFRQQNRTLNLQRFENTFFNMLDLHHRIVNEMDITSSMNALQFAIEGGKDRPIITGRDVFKDIFLHKLSPRMRDIDALEEISEAYDDLYLEYQTDLGHYFRNLYRIIKMVYTRKFNFASENIDFNTKYEYTSILRAQLSNYELLWLFYNCLSEYGNNFKPFVEHFGLLKNLKPSQLPNPNHASFYGSNAFKGGTRELSQEDWEALKNE